jgi:ElaB/YqjD/DUF883 family membrane-anchored ribosome-binding protein
MSSVYEEVGKRSNERSVAGEAINRAAERVRPSQDKLVQDFKTMIGDAEELLRSLAGASGEGLGVARERFNAKLASAKQVVSDAESSLHAKVDSAAEATRTYVTENPWRAIAVAASVGAVVGYLMRR